MAAGDFSSVLRPSGDLVAHMDVGSAGDDLEGLISHVHLADHQLVCVGMAVDGKDLAYYDLFKIFVKTLESFYLCSGQVMASVYSWAVTSRSGTYAFIQDKDVFIVCFLLSVVV